MQAGDNAYYFSSTNLPIGCITQAVRYQPCYSRNQPLRVLLMLLLWLAEALTRCSRHTPALTRCSRHTPSQGCMRWGPRAPSRHNDTAEAGQAFVSHGVVVVYPSSSTHIGATTLLQP
jgi:hypothetical protein